MNLEIFADRLSDLIFDSKKSVTEVANEMGINKSTLYEYLLRERIPRLSSIVKIADYFNCSTDFLLGLEDEISGLVFKECKPFPEQFKEILSYFNISRYRLQKMTGLAESVLFYWSKGQKTPTLESVLLVCEKLDCRVDFFIGRSDI